MYKTFTASMAIWISTVAYTTLAFGGDLPMTGKTVPQLTGFDDVMQEFMADYGLAGGVLAVAKDGCIVYQRGFGYDLIPSRVMSEMTPMRIASVEKPIVAALVRNLAAGNWFSLNDFVFDLGQPEGGLLDIQPYAGLGDDRLEDITVLHLIQHMGGWDIDVMDWCENDRCDPQFQSLLIAEELGVGNPAGRTNTVRFMLSQELSWTPGTTFAYSNFGYMLLGLIVEEVTGATVYWNIRNRVLTPEMWVPGSEILLGRTFNNVQSPREPFYISNGMATNVFNPGGDDVPWPYGGWDHESFQGHGNLVTSAAPLLKLADAYQLRGNNIGMSITQGTINRSHNGSIDGIAAIATQRDDGVSIVALIPDRTDIDDFHFGNEISSRIQQYIDDGNIATWPTTCIDGHWVNFTALNPGYGGYSDPFDDMDDVVNSVWDGTRLHFQPGFSGPWSGVLDKKMILDAPNGSVVIGE